MKPKNMTEAQFLELLQKVLPKATEDARVASSIYDQVAKEIRLIHNVQSFEAFCAQGSLPNLEPATVAEFQSQLEINFGAANVALTPAEKGDAMSVQIVLPDRTITNRLRVQAPGTWASPPALERECSQAAFPVEPPPLTDRPQARPECARGVGLRHPAADRLHHLSTQQVQRRRRQCPGIHSSEHASILAHRAKP